MAKFARAAKERFTAREGLNNTPRPFAGVAQLVRAGVSYALGRGFDSLLRHLCQKTEDGFFEHESVVGISVVLGAVVTRKIRGEARELLVQSVERASGRLDVVAASGALDLRCER
jgi:hypothetical protein